MSAAVYRYQFSPSVPLEEVEASLVLALLAVESLHGEAQVHLDATHSFDSTLRRCVIETGTEVGQDLNRLFTGFLRREFGEDSFQVDRISGLVPAAAS